MYESELGEVKGVNMGVRVVVGCSVVVRKREYGRRNTGIGE